MLIIIFNGAYSSTYHIFTEKKVSIASIEVSFKITLLFLSSKYRVG